MAMVGWAARQPYVLDWNYSISSSFRTLGGLTKPRGYL